MQCILSAADNESTLIIVTDNSAEKCVAPFDGDVISKRNCAGRAFYNVSALSLPRLMKAISRVY